MQVEAELTVAGSRRLDKARASGGYDSPWKSEEGVISRDIFRDKRAENWGGGAG